RYGRALQKLTQLFDGGDYAKRPLLFQPYPLSLGGQPLADIRDEGDANTAWEAINQLIIDLKNEQHTLHICISGGRRILGLLTMSAAMLHFGHQDVLWHMYTPDELRQAANEGAIMHAPPNSGFRLIRVPMMPWGSYFPALRQMARPTAAERDVLAAPRAALDYAEEARKTAVLQQLTERQTEVLFAFAAGLNPQQVAERLFISIKTVDTHKTVILAECRNAWNLPDETWLDYRFLADKFEAVQESSPTRPNFSLATG
ncbi:MAG: histidine kinase, partial [Chloroflexi bacterium]|nr:histidine kinase [Chloroflexota bacterium]